MIIRKIAYVLCAITMATTLGVMVYAIHQPPIVAEVTETTEAIETVETTETVVEETIEETEEPTVETTEETAPQIDTEALELLACVIYQEAGGDAQCDDCRRRVADVVLNRVEDTRFPNTIGAVLTQEGQYGRFQWTGVVWPDRASASTEAHAVERAYRIAEEVLRGQHSELYGNGYIWQAEFIKGAEGFECCDIYFGR